MAKVKSFSDILNEANKAYEQAEQERKNLQDMLYVAEKEKEKRGATIVRLQKLAYLAGYSFNPLEWHKREFEENHFKYSTEVEWKELFELETAELEMSVCLWESKKHKKFKYIVEARAWRTHLSGKPGEVHGGYRSTDYGKDKYMKRIEYGRYEEIPGQELTKSFSKLEDARAYAEQWKKRLVDDHAEEIAADRAIYDMVKAEGLVYDPNYRRPGFMGGYGAIVPLAEKTKF